MSTKNNPGSFDCYAKAEPDEPMFILLARDPLAPILVDLWASMREVSGHVDFGKIDNATDVAEAMRQWRDRRKYQRRKAMKATRVAGKTEADVSKTEYQLEDLCAICGAAWRFHRAVSPQWCPKRDENGQVIRMDWGDRTTVFTPRNQHDRREESK